MIMYLSLNKTVTYYLNEQVLSMRWWLTWGWECGGMLGLDLELRGGRDTIMGTQAWFIASRRCKCSAVIEKKKKAFFWALQHIVFVTTLTNRDLNRTMRWFIWLRWRQTFINMHRSSPRQGRKQEKKKHWREKKVRQRLQRRYELSGSSLSFLSKATDVATATSMFW